MASSWRRRMGWIAAAALLLVVLGVDFLFTGIWTVDRSEQGVVLRFGRAQRVCSAGIHFTLPYPFETLVKVETGRVRQMPVGFRLEDREVGLPPLPEEVQWLTGDTNIVEIQTDVQYRVIDPVRYLYRVADLQRESLIRDHVLRKLTEGVLTELVARMEVDDVLSSGKLTLQETTRSRVQRLVEEHDLGLQIISVNIVEANPPLAVKGAFNDVSSANADRERMITEADGYVKDLIPKARARANRIVQDAEIYADDVVSAAKGEAGQFVQLADKVRLAPLVSRRRIWLDKLEEILARPRKVVYPRRPGEVFKLTEVK